MAARQQKGKAKTSAKQNEIKKVQEPENVFFGEAALLGILAVCILLFLSNFGVGGIVGEKVSGFFFGIFGLIAYLAPICFFIGAAFYISNKHNRIAVIKLIASVFFVAFLCLFIELVIAGEADGKITDSFAYGMTKKNGGGIIGGALSHLLCKAFGTIGAYVVDIIILIICLVFITERSFLGGVKKGSKKVYDSAREDAARYREHAAQRREERGLREEQRQRQREERKQQEQEEQRRREQQKRLDKKAVGVSTNTKIVPPVLEASDNLSELKPAKQTPQFSKNAMAKLFPTEKAAKGGTEAKPYGSAEAKPIQDAKGGLKQDSKAESKQVVTAFQRKTGTEDLPAAGASLEESHSLGIEPTVFRAKPTIVRREPTLVTMEPTAAALGTERKQTEPSIEDRTEVHIIKQDAPREAGEDKLEQEFGIELPVFRRGEDSETEEVPESIQSYETEELSSANGEEAETGFLALCRGAVCGGGGRAGDQRGAGRVSVLFLRGSRIAARLF